MKYLDANNWKNIVRYQTGNIKGEVNEIKLEVSRHYSLLRLSYKYELYAKNPNTYNISLIDHKDSELKTLFKSLNDILDSRVRLRKKANLDGILEILNDN